MDIALSVAAFLLSIVGIVGCIVPVSYTHLTLPTT